MNGKVLIVDDSRAIRQLLARFLEKIGLQIVEAEDGVEALRRLEEAPDARLILCDMNMPRMDGLGFLLNARSAGSLVPVVMITTEGEPEQIQRAKDLGARGWLIKPFRRELVVAAVTKLMQEG